MAWHSVHLLLPHDKVHNMAAKTKIITNSNNMYICESSLFFIVFNTLWTHKCMISSILTVTEGGSNDIYDVVSS